MIYGYPALYQPTTAPTEPPPIPDHHKASAKEAGASHISADGEHGYMTRFGGWYQADYDGNVWGSWFPCGKMPEGVIEV